MHHCCDRYGKFSVSWGAGLGQYLDPEATGALFVDTLAVSQPTPPPAPTPPPTPCTGMDVEIKILTDDYPGETEWTLTETTECLGGNPVGSGGPYSGASTWYSESYCLANGKYQFEISDSYGDGNCCGYGDGKYEIWLNQQMVHMGGEFGASETKTIGSCQTAPTDVSL